MVPSGHVHVVSVTSTCSSLLKGTVLSSLLGISFQHKETKLWWEVFLSLLVMER